MLDRAIGPPVPERTSARTSLTISRDRKRQSLPAHSQDGQKRSRNRVTVTPASTEVISSLIDTLSAISTPAEHHFDALPSIATSHSTPASPSPWRSNSSLEPPSRTSTYGSHKQGGLTRGNDLLRPEDASSIINGSSPRRIASEQSSRNHAEYENMLDDSYSIGNISIEPGSPVSIAPKEPRKQKSLRSIRSLKSLRLKPSKDSLRIPDGTKRTPDGDADRGRERLYIKESPPPSPALSHHDILNHSARQGSPAPRVVPARASSERSATASQRLYLSSPNISRSTSSSTRNSPTIPDQSLIPTRNSSIRHTSEGGISSLKPRSRPRRPVRSATQASETETVDEQFHTPPQTPPLSSSSDAGEDVVARRIRELKDQKLKRDLLSLEAISDALRMPSTPLPSPLPSPRPSPQPVAQRVEDKKPPGMAKGPSSFDLDETTLLEEGDKTAPAPTIAQRIKRNNSGRITSLYIKPTIVKHSPENRKDDSRRASLGSHSRSGSKLMKRLSQPASPTPDRSKRLSNTPSQPTRSASYQIERGDPIDDAVEEYLTSPKLSQKIANPQTGRVISFSEVGDPNGSVVFCCVGMGLTRYITAFYDELATTLKLRLITPDRPGVGDSEPHADGLDTPLAWPDDVRTICEHRAITKFSILAHSAGAIYALATALRMPQHIRCRVHLLAPWIPPSQMSAIGTHQDPLPSSALPYSQRFLRSLPTTFLRAANSSFLSVTSNSITTSLPRSPRRTKAKPTANRSDTPPPLSVERPTTAPSKTHDPSEPHDTERDPPRPAPPRRGSAPLTEPQQPKDPTPPHKSESYDTRLAAAIWDLATTHANSAVDLIVCLERRQPIGFRYVDITRAVVIHHGSKDSRVPVENVRWLGKMMRRCEVRVLEGEGHGLMASAAVMGGVLTEMAAEWEDWNRVVRG